MKSVDSIKFLGTAGARFVVARQLRSSAGVFITMKDLNIVLDPGPGTFVRLAKSRPPIDVTKLDAIILTHAHIDHSNDVNVLIDAMTGGGLKKKGVLFAPDDCLNGNNAVVLPYVRSFLRTIITLKPRETYAVNTVSFSTSGAHRHQVETYGVMFNHCGCKISFLVDTQFFPELINDYKGSDLLVINVVRSTIDDQSKIMHLCVEDVKKLLSAIRPRRTVLTHFGMTMHRAKPWMVAKDLSNDLGLDVIAASDGMRIELEGNNSNAE